MNEWILISALIITALIVIGLILIVVLVKRKKEEKTGEINYKVFFIIGLAWIPTGIVFMITINIVMGIAFIGMGVSYMAIGLANRDKWNN